MIWQACRPGLMPARVDGHNADSIQPPATAMMIMLPGVVKGFH